MILIPGIYKMKKAETWEFIAFLTQYVLLTYNCSYHSLTSYCQALTNLC